MLTSSLLGSKKTKKKQGNWPIKSIKHKCTKLNNCPLFWVMLAGLGFNEAKLFCLLYHCIISNSLTQFSFKHYFEIMLLLLSKKTYMLQIAGASQSRFFSSARACCWLRQAFQRLCLSTCIPNERRGITISTVFVPRSV